MRTPKNKSSNKVSKRLQSIFKKYGEDAKGTNIQKTRVWLRKVGYPALADLLSDGKK